MTPLVQVERLNKVFVGGRRAARQGLDEVRAVEDVTFSIARGESFGLVGESGCGKTTIARCVLRLVEATAGRVLFDGVDLATLGADELRALRKRMQIVFQDPYASLDPRMTVHAIVEEPLIIHGVRDQATRREAVLEMLSLVGLSPEHAGRKPYAFSGGQRQRIGVARALILRPDFIVLDEPVSALDVSIQAQVLNLLQDIQEQLDLTYLFITHDLVVAEHFCDRVAVLYLGRVMELGDRRELFRNPLHPYTTSLLSAVPVADPDAEPMRHRIVLSGEVGISSAPAGGCPFRPRCPVGANRAICEQETPPLVESPVRHWTACHFPGELRPLPETLSAHEAAPSATGADA